MFNSLNVLAALIDENTDKAQQFTTSLSQVYRYVLEQRDKDLVEVKEEIDFIKVYARLLSMRFEDAFEIHLDSTIQPHFLMPPLSLQLLIENAVKHNTISSQEKLEINIYQKSNYLYVENTLQLKSHFASANTGIGLANIKNRYKNFTNLPVKISAENQKFVVALPFIEHENE